MTRWTWCMGAALAAGAVALPARAADWPQWGRTNDRNMVSPETGLPSDFKPGKTKPGGDEPDPATMANVKWVAKLGTQSYGNPTVAGGRVFVGTNNDNPRDPEQAGDRGAVMAFSEADGSFLWQLLVPKLAAGKASDWEQVGLCSSPTVDGDRVYVVTNRCEVVCLSAAGDTGASQVAVAPIAPDPAGPDHPTASTGARGAQVLWRYSMRDELGVFPHNMSACSVLVVGDRLYASTCNGVDWTNRHIPMPDAPALICLDKKSGKLLGQERAGISKRTFHSNWCSPSWGKVANQEMIFFGGGDGFCYAFDPLPQADGTLREIWRFDCNPPELRTRDGKPLKYGNDAGPSEVIGTPVLYKDRVYVAIGQDPESNSGSGCLSCIDATKTGDVTATGKVWQFRQITRTLATCAIANGLVFLGDLDGVVHCLDADAGEELWSHDLQEKIWGSPLIADGKVYVGDAAGVVAVFAASKEKKLLGTPHFDGHPVYSTLIAANGVLYVMTDQYLYALQQKPGK